MAVVEHRATQLAWMCPSRESPCREPLHMRGVLLALRGASLTGEFVELFPGRAMLIDAIDLGGDSREEVVTLEESSAIRICPNTRPNPRRQRPSPWAQQHDRRQKRN